MAHDDDGWLIAGPTDPDEVRRFYDEWAGGYDADLADWSYRAPERVAALTCEFGDVTLPLLDAGCGTGLSGRALRNAGWTGDIHGIDLSEESLRVAHASGAYTDAAAASLHDPLVFDDDVFGAVACVGVLTYVPDVESCWREFCRVVRSGGVVAFTQREDMWNERDCDDVIDRLAAGGVWTPLVVTDAEPYLPTADDEISEVGVHYVVCRTR